MPNSGGQHGAAAGSFQFEPEDGCAFTSTAHTVERFGMDNTQLSGTMYFVLEIRNNRVMRVSVSRHALGSALDLDPVLRRNAPDRLTLAEFYLNRYIAYYPG